VSLNRWVFKWRFFLKVKMFSDSRMSAGREFQVYGAGIPVLARVMGIWYTCGGFSSIGVLGMCKPWTCLNRWPSGFMQPSIPP